MSKSQLSKIADIGNLREVWRKFYSTHKKTLSGSDGVSAAEFRRNEETNLRSLKNSLLTGYTFSPLRGRAFRKPNSTKHRIICIPTIADRLVQRAVCNFLIDETHDRLGLKNGISFAFLKGEGGVPRAQDNAKRYRAAKPWVYKSDITSFFDTIRRPDLISKVRKKLRFPTLLPLIDGMIKCEAIPEDGFTKRKMEEANIEHGVGLRQGMPISPLLANLVLDEFDATIMSMGLTLVRYADDFIILTASEDECYRAHELARAQLKKIDLTIPDIGDHKTQIKGPSEPVGFLGLLISPTQTGSYDLLIDEDQKAEIFDRLGKMVDLAYLQREGINIANLMKKVRDIQGGYLNAYSNAEASSLQSFRDKLEATISALPEKILKGIFPPQALGKLPPIARHFLCLD